MKYKIKTFIEQNERIPVTKEFITKNKLHMARTSEAILHKIKEHDDEIFDFWGSELIHYLPYQLAKPQLTDEAQKKYYSGKGTWKQITEVEEAVQDFLDYMVFAWEKAENMRGLSASRSINKLSCWMWLLGREDVMEVLTDDSLYNPYGTPALVKACEMLGIKVSDAFIKFSGIKV